MVKRSQSHYPDIGVLGEDLVAQWLQSLNWIILHRRWRCRWGEIDIIALEEPKHTTKQEPEKNFPLLAFVEVKTRSCGNWDAGGLLAITPQKQTRLLQAANCFLATYPNLENYSCRFDVALVYYQKIAKIQHESLSLNNAKYQLCLQEYLPSAFS